MRSSFAEIDAWKAEVIHIERRRHEDVLVVIRGFSYAMMKMVLNHEKNIISNREITRYLK